jgi:predicted dinucleotide-binding enzyme
MVLKTKRMEFKKLASMNIAIIGNTDIAVRYAKAFAASDHEVFMATSSGEIADPGVPDAEGINACTITQAAAIADLIIIATEPKDVREAAYWLEDVRRKVIIDVTSNVMVPEHEKVSTTCAITTITGSAHVVKMFNTAGYTQLLEPLFGNQTPELLILSDSLKGKELAKIMAIEIGLTKFHDFGGTQNIPLFAEMTTAWRALKQNLAKATLHAHKK